MIVKLYGMWDRVIVEVTGDNVGYKHEWEVPTEITDDIEWLTIRIEHVDPRSNRVIHVHAIEDGTWSFAVAKTADNCDDFYPLPPWSYTLANRSELSTELTIDTGSDEVTVMLAEDAVL